MDTMDNMDEMRAESGALRAEWSEDVPSAEPNTLLWQSPRLYDVLSILSILSISSIPNSQRR